MMQEVAPVSESVCGTAAWMSSVLVLVLECGVQPVDVSTVSV